MQHNNYCLPDENLQSLHLGLLLFGMDFDAVKHLLGSSFKVSVRALAMHDCGRG